MFASALSVLTASTSRLCGRIRTASFPPRHINFLSIAGFEAAFARAGLVDIDVSTPGKLDVDVPVRNAYIRAPSVLSGNRFAQLVTSDVERGAAFQEFLTKNCLSSHAWVMGRKLAGSADAEA